MSEFLEATGRLPVVEIVERTGPDPAELVMVEEAISATLAAMGADDADVTALSTTLAELKARRAALRTAGGTTVEYKPTGRTFAETWEATVDVDERRALLASAIDLVRVRRGARGGRISAAERVDVVWRADAL